MKKDEFLLSVIGDTHPSSLDAFLDKVFPDPDDRISFLLWLAKKESPHTKRAYFSDIMAFMWFLREKLGKTRLTAVEYQDIEMFSISIVRMCAYSGKSINSARRRVSAVKSLFSFLLESARIAKNPSVAVKPPREADSLHERILSEQEVADIIDCEKNIRNKTLIKFLYNTGVRVSEASGIRWRDIHSGTGDTKPSVTVLGKGKKIRIIVFSKKILEDLQNLWHNQQDRDEPLFLSRKAGALSPSQIFRIVRNATKKAGINRPVSPHWFRHAHATHALSHGAPINLLMSHLGHQSAEMTIRYTHIMPQEGSCDYLPF